MDSEKRSEWWQLQEPSFHSQVPLLGRLIVAVRTLWNNVATRWYVLPLLQQQNDINRRLVEELRLLREDLNLAFECLAELDNDLVDAHRIQTQGLYHLQKKMSRFQEHLESILNMEGEA